MKIISSIKDAIVIIFFIIVPVLLLLNLKQNREKNRIVNNFNIERAAWVTKEGEYASRVSLLHYHLQELRDVNNRDSIQYSIAQKELLKAKETIKKLNLKLKNIDSYVNTDIVVKDTIITKVEFIDTCRLKSIEPINTLHLSMSFYTIDDSIQSEQWPIIANNDLLITYKYIASINTVIDRQPALLNKKGKKRFIIARWIYPKYKYYGTSIVDDPNAVIQNNVIIKFKK